MSMEMDFSDYGSEEEMDSGGYPKSGQYHAAVLDVDDDPEGIEAIKVEFEVLAGTVPHQDGKQFTETFWRPNANHKDGGKFAAKKIYRFLKAVGLADEKALGRKVSIDWQAAKGMQLVVAVEEYERKGADKKGNQRTYKGAQIEGLNIYPVDDPEVAAVPKDETALAMLPGKSEGGKGSNGNGNGQGNGAAKTNEEAKQTAAAADPYAD